MSSNLNGGFFVTLGLDTNKNSFEEGRKAIDQIGVGVTNLLGTVRTAVPLIAAGLTAINDRTADTYASSAALGFSVRQYEAWGAAAKRCKVNAEGLYSGMEKLESIRVRIKHGDAGAADSLAQPLGWLGITDLAAFINQDPAQRVTQVFEAASAKVKSGAMDLKEASDTVGQALGGEFGKLFMNERTLGLSFFGLLNKYYSDSYMDQDAAKKAMGFNREVEDTMYLLKQMGEFAGSEFGGAFTPMLKELNEFLRDHKDDIKAGLADLAEGIGSITQAVIGFAGPVLASAVEMFKDLVGALSALLNADWEALANKLDNFFSHFGLGIKKLFGVDDDQNSDTFAEDIQKQYEEARGIGKAKVWLKEQAGTLAGVNGDYNKAQKFKDDFKKKYGLGNSPIEDQNRNVWEEVNDEGKLELIDFYDSLQNKNNFPFAYSDNGWGQVSADVEAARKLKVERAKQKALNDTLNSAESLYKKNMKRSSLLSTENNSLMTAAASLAANFMPAGFASFNSGGNVINQNITINGAADVATAVREEAYRGANEGLLGAINAGAQRLQLMTGLS